MKFIFIVLFVFCIGCAHVSVQQKRQKKMYSADMSKNLPAYIGDWKVKKKTYGCFPIKIEKGPKEGTLKITSNRATHVISTNSRFNTLPKTTKYDYSKYKLSSSSLHKFIRGKIVFANIWAPDTNNWLGVGLRTLTIDKRGTLIKKKAGLTMQDKSNDPREKAISIFKLNGDDVILKWQVECEYIKI